MRDSLYALPVEPEVPPAPAEVVNFLEAKSMPIGLSRVFVELVGDGLATGIRVPVLVARGKKDGPVFGITSAIHGNELNGIPVIHQLFSELDLDKLRGTVVGVVALNVPGLHLHQREFIDGQDLNRIMPGDPGGNVSQVYAHRILERIVLQLDYLMDLHTASFGRVNSLYVRANMRSEKTARMAYLQHPEIIVHNAGTDTTLRGAAMKEGIAAITVEIGDPQRWQSKYTPAALHGLRAVMAMADVIDYDEPPPEREEPVLCSRSSWMYTDRGGLLRVYPTLTAAVDKDQKVATITNAFGDVIREYQAPEAGVVVGKSVNPVGQTGARILHLGFPAQPADGLFTPADLELET